jgi:hypothetical protein
MGIFNKNEEKFVFTDKEDEKEKEDIKIIDKVTLRSGFIGSKTFHLKKQKKKK